MWFHGVAHRVTVIADVRIVKVSDSFLFVGFDLYGVERFGFVDHAWMIKIIPEENNNKACYIL